jgi:hypothetical protein
VGAGGAGATGGATTSLDEHRTARSNAKSGGMIDLDPRDTRRKP